MGLPTKDKLEKPIFDYEKKLFDILFSSSQDFNRHDFKNKHLWVKKATGFGITEFMLRFMGRLCLKDNVFRNSQACIFTGSDIHIAIKLIKTFKDIFEAKLGINFDNKETVPKLN